MQELKQSSTAKPLVFFMYDSSDHVTGKTGLSPTVVISKNGASFASPSGAVSEIANGFYKVAGNATDTNTLGVLALSATASGADQATMAYNVVAYDPDAATNLGLSALPTTAAGASGGLPLGVDASGRVDVLKINGTSQTARDLGASVLLSPGTGTGQLSITSGIASVNSTQFAGQTITASAGVTIPASIASPTNITAGTITTVTNLTNAPTAGDFTATMKTSLNAATPAVTVSDKTGFSLSSTQTFSNTGTWTGNIVGTLSTLTTYTGNTPQTGDSYARIGAPSGASISADIQTRSTFAGGAVASVTAAVTLPAAPTDWITAASVKADAVTKIQAGLSTYAGGDTSGTTTLLSRVTGVVLLASGYTAPDNSSITAIKAKTDNLPSDPASQAALVVYLTKVQAAVYDTATVVGSTITLSNGHTLTVTTGGRVLA